MAAFYDYHVYEDFPDYDDYGPDYKNDGPDYVDFFDKFDGLCIGEDKEKSKTLPHRLYKCTLCGREWYSSSSDETQKCMPCSRKGYTQKIEMKRTITIDLSDKELDIYFRDDNGNLKQVRRLFGWYRCPNCNRTWCSASSWADNFQQCKSCIVKTYPYKLTKLKRKADDDEDGEEAPHQQDLCGKCKELGYRCMPLKSTY